LPKEPGVGAVLAFRLVDPVSLEILPPPLTEAPGAAIHRHLIASAN
jgi:hypothetical protein